MHEYVRTAAEAAIFAGDILLKYSKFVQDSQLEESINPDRNSNIDQQSENQHQEFIIQDKGNNDLVTTADNESESAIISYIKQKYPDHNFICEESGSQINSKKNIDQDEVVWIIDPLDGTTNFANGSDYFCISIGVKVNGKPTHGVIYRPSNGDLIWASVGEGAFLTKVNSLVGSEHTSFVANSRRIKKNSNLHEWQNGNKNVIGTGFAYKRTGQPLEQLLQNFEQVLQEYGDVRRTGSSALDLAHLAAGRMAGFYEVNLKIWDIYAAIVILRESGKKITNLFGSDDCVAENCSIIAGDLQNHSKLLKILTQEQLKNISDVVAEEVQKTKERTSANYDLNRRLPEQDLFKDWQQKASAINSNLYGESYLPAFLYDGLIDMSHMAETVFYHIDEAGVISTSSANQQPRTMPRLESDDHYVTMLKMDSRSAFIKDYLENVRGPYSKSGNRYVFGNGINNTIYPDITFAEEAIKLEKLHDMVQLNIKEDGRNPSFAARMEFLGNLNKEYPSRDHAAIYKELVSSLNKKPDELFYYEEPESKKILTQDDIYAKGIEEGELGIISSSINVPPHRYLSATFTRQLPLKRVVGKGQIELLKNPGIVEELYIRANEVPYMEKHGLAISGLHKPQACTFPDIERLCNVAQAMNPPVEFRLPTDRNKTYVVARNANSGSSIPETAHEQIFMGSTSRFPVFGLNEAPRHLDDLNLDVDVVQIGSVKDASYIKFTTNDILKSDFIELVNDLIFSMQNAFNAGEGNSYKEIIDFQIQVVPDNNDNFNLIIYPFARLAIKEVGMQKIKYNPSLSEEENVQYSDKVEVNMSCGVAAGQILGTQTQIDIWQKNGHKALQDHYDATRLNGTREFLDQYIEQYVQRQKTSYKATMV